MSATPTSERPGLLTVRQVSEILGCSPRHVYRMSDSGRMPRPVRLGALTRWPAHTGDPSTGVEDWVSAGCPACRQARKGGVR